MTKKNIALSKEETAKDLAGYLASESAETVIFTIPKFSGLADAPEAFLTAKKIADAMGKEIRIESVDDAILASAKAAGIPAENPFFSNDSSPAWESEDALPAKFADGPQEDPSPAPVAMPVVARMRPVPKPVYRRKIESDDDDEEMAPKPRLFMGRKRLWIAAIAVLSVPAYWVAFVALPHADIVIVTHKEPFVFNGVMTLEKNGPVPTVLVSDKKNAQMSFPALGKKNVSQKAAGKITVFNAYSSQPQQLVATTRFEAPDGKIVRLAANVMIPGAKIEGGTITPSSIEADVVADKPGPAYNLTGGKLSIPGFKGSAKFSGFYGEVKTPLAGGFVGEAAYPTDDDLKSAKAKVAEVLQSSLSGQLSTKAGKDYVIVPGSAQLTVTKTSVNPQVNGKGEFSLFAEADLRAVAFKESDLIGYFTGKMKDEKGDEYSFKETRLKYDSPKADFAAQKLMLSVDFAGVAEQPIAIAAIRGQVAGKSVAELKAVLFSVPGIEGSAEITLWPGYVRHVPASPTAENLTITIK